MVSAEGDWDWRKGFTAAGGNCGSAFSALPMVDVAGGFRFAAELRSVMFGC